MRAWPRPKTLFSPRPDPIGAHGIRTSQPAPMQPFGDDEVFRRVKDLEAVVAEDARHFDEAEHIGLQRVVLRSLPA